MKTTLSKSEFKLQYSEYRKHVSSSRKFGRDAFCQALDLNPLYRSCLIKNRMPVSVRVWLHLNKSQSN